MHHDKRLSTSSYADSGYFASSVTSTATNLDPSSRSLQHTVAYYGPAAERSRASSVQSSRSKRVDNVIACPRPLAFPFHNDSYFLPVAETPQSRTASSYSTSTLVSSSTLAGSSNTDDSRRRTSDILSIRPGTVRSLKLKFENRTEQAPANSTKDNIAGEGTASQVHSPIRTTFSDIKEGTVKALQKLFTSKAYSPDTVPPDRSVSRGWKFWTKLRARNNRKEQTSVDKHRVPTAVHGDASTPLLQEPLPAYKRPIGTRYFQKLSKPQWWLSKPNEQTTAESKKSRNPITSIWSGFKSIVRGRTL
ncbi:hypothetical protein INT43_000611 [Umbelopsis isabellina]|uniref:Uncharacterized protein n=1 Tax=Mortierella isabellina TaxID=91625 RepID=A0A8H7Q2G5_MORIS|nr:hypothetical protein INT43_000611 [Umbelopsis isabellina]